MTTPTQSTPLKACPFCGGTDIKEPQNTYAFWTVCNDDMCSAETIARPTRKEARELWNTRADAPQIADSEWFFRWASRAKADGRYEEAINTIFHHPENPYAIENPWAAVTNPTPPITGDRLALGVDEFRTLVEEAMNYEWGDWCGDTGTFPPDFDWRGGNGTLSFTAGKWAGNVAEYIFNSQRIKAALTAPVPSEAVEKLEAIKDCAMDDVTRELASEILALLGGKDGSQ